MFKSWVHFVHMSASSKAHGNGQTTIRRLFEVLFRATMDCPHTYSQTHTWGSLWGHCFLIHFCTCLYLLPVLPFLHVWVSPSHSKKKERKTAWVNLSRETSSGSFSFFKRTPPDLMFNLWRRAQAWYILAWQSIFLWETWIGPDQTRGDMPVPIRAPGCHRLVNSWEQNQPFHWNQSVVN